MSYRYVDIDSDKAAQRRVRRLQRGRRRIPTVVLPTSGRVLVEPANAELEAALADDLPGTP